MNFTVGQATTTTTITSDNPDPSVVGQTITVNYTVVGQFGGTPTGSVTVSDGVNSCMGTVAAGSCNVALTTAGARTLTATYAGDANFLTSNDTEPHQVNLANTTTTITAESADPTLQGENFTVFYAVAASAPGAGAPSGTVTVSDGVNSCMGTVAAGQCSLALNTAGARTLTATYAGNPSFNGSVSPGEPHTVTQLCVTNPVVANNLNSGAGSLRQAVIDACPGNTITFGGMVVGPIQLLSQITIDKNLIIDAQMAGMTVQNTAAAGSFSRGFGVDPGVTAELRRLNIIGGNPVTSGGGITNAGTLTLLNSTVSGNQSSSSGGGIYNTGSLTLTNSTVSGNISQTDGGGINNNVGTLILTNSTFSGNSAGGPPPPIAGESGDRLETSNLAGGFGGGIFSNGGSASLVNSTLSNNYSITGTGEGLYATGAGTATLKNTIIANSFNGGDCAQSGSTVNATYSLIESGLGCVNGTNTNNLTGDPLLGPLAANGGSTNTHALLVGSIVIDKGAVAAGVTTDQRGTTRPTDFPGIPNAAGGNGSDIGSFELTDTTPPTLTSIVDDVSGGPRTAGTVITYTVTFSEAVTGVDAADFNNAGTAGITVGTPMVVGNVVTLPITTTSAGTLILRIPTGATITDLAGNLLVVPVQDDTTITISAQPSVSINDISLAEGNAGTTTFGFTVSLSAVSTQTVMVSYNTADNSATVADLDYQAVGTTVLTFTPGQTSKTVNILVNGDTKVEPAETFFVNLSAVANATILDNQGLGTIQNDDATALSINDVSFNEGNAGTTTFGFTVSLTNPSATNVTVDYATADNTATTANNDYAGIATTTLTFTPGQTTKTVNVLVNGDLTVEPNETFFVNLANASGATISDNQGIGTIQNDDATALSINDISLNEGNAGTTTFGFTVSLTNPSATNVTVDYATADSSATTANNDYAGIATTTLTFTPGQTTKTVNVLVNGDLTVEPNETFFVNLANPSGATISDNQGLGTIQNDDVTAVSIGDVTLAEGNAGTTAFNFAVSLTNPSSTSITLDYATADGTANAGTDYTGIGTTQLTFLPGETMKLINVSVSGDLTVELSETFFVNLTNVVGASVTDGQGLGTITNDDVPTLSVNDVSMNEGNSGTTTFTFTATLSQPNPAIVSVKYATADNTATVADNDYVAVPLTTLTFAANQPSKTFTVSVNGDTNVELNESFFVNLSMADNATISDNQGIGTIQNDDTPAISITDVAGMEGNSGTSNFDFQVTLSQPSTLPISVDFITADGTAIAFTDYVGLPITTLNFAPGETSKIVAVTVNGDTDLELNETFFVNLSNPVNATILDNQGIGTITNDDSPVLSINDLSMNEGASGTTSFGFTVTLSPASPDTVTVKYSTATGTLNPATPGTDYTEVAAPVLLTFAPGETTKTANVLINGDTTPELNETFFVNLTMPTGAIALDTQGLGTIINDDTPTISVDDVSQVEGDSGTTTFNHTITLSQASPLSVSVSYATSDGTATAGSDYVAIPLTSVTFAPGETTKPVAVTVNGDTTTEINETYNIDLSLPTNATIADNLGVGTITNDDIPTLSVNDVTQVEGNSGLSDFAFTVSLSQASPVDVSVNYATAPGTASAPGDFIAIPSTLLTFAAGETTKTVNVQVVGDNVIEPNETFFVDLSTPTNATIADNQGLGTIINDDTQSLRVTDARVREGNSGTATLEFTVTLMLDNVNPDGPTVVTVDYQTADDTATAGSSDYVATNGSLTFNPGETTKTFNVTVNGDTRKEPNETFFVNLSNAINAGISDGQGVGIIIDEDRSYISDFDGDRITDYSVYRPGTNVWYVLQSTNGIPNVFTYGTPGDIITPGDFDGDGRFDRAYFRPSNGTWAYVRSSDSVEVTLGVFGLNGDIPVQGDYDNDGKTDRAVFRPSNGTWYIRQSSNGAVNIVQFGASGDKPVQADYDGDGQTDIGVFRNGVWYVLRSASGTISTDGWGLSNDVPVTGDFDGDGRNDLTIFRPSDGTWWIRQSLTNTVRALPFGVSTDIPTAADYDGDGTSDVAIFRRVNPGTTTPNGDWYVLRSSNSVITGVNWGTNGDIPIPKAYLPQ